MAYVAKLHQACIKVKDAKEAAEAAAKIAEAKCVAFCSPLASR